MKHPQIRRARKVGEAVFRGAHSVYTFEVFPLTTDIRDGAAVYVISRRIVDRFKTGHHRTICVGEAASIVSEIRKHKRAKCARSNEANAICVLRENDGQTRSNVIDDLVAARSFTCIRNVSKPIIKPARAVEKTKPGKRKARPSAGGEPVPLRVAGTNALKTKVSKSKPTNSKTAARTKDPAAAAKKRRLAKTHSADLAGERSTPKRSTGTVKKRDSRGRSRVQSIVDNNGRQRLLPSREKPVGRRAKARTAGKSRARSKLAA